MYSRLTNQIMNSASKQNISDSLQRLYDLQQKASTGKNYATGSENPAVAAQGISLRSTQNQIKVYQDTMAATKTWLDTNDQALQQMTNILKNAQSQVLQAMNGAQGPDEHKVIATALDGIIQQLIDVGNSQDVGRYVFSGLKTDTKPFVLMSGSAGAIVDQIPVNMSITADASGSLTLNSYRIDYNLATKPNELMVDGHTIDINSKYLADGVTPNPNYPTYTVDGQAIIPNPPTTSGSLNFEGLTIYGNTDPAATTVFTVNGTGITTTPASGSNIIPPGGFSIIYSGGTLTSSSGSVMPVAGDPTSFYVNGAKITVDSSGSPPVYYVDGQTVSTGTQGYTYLNDVTLHSGSAFGVPASGSPFGGLVSGSAILRHDYVKYQGDGNVITRSIAPSQSMTIGVNGGSTMDPAGGMFDTLIKLRDILNSENYISPHELTTASGSVAAYQVAQQIGPTQNTTSHVATVFENQEPSFNSLSQAYGQLLQVSNSVSEQLSVNGTRLQNLQNATDRADKANLEITAQLSQNEDVNMAQAISDVNNQTIVYQAVINMSAKVQNTINLFDKI